MTYTMACHVLPNMYCILQVIYITVSKGFLTLDTLFIIPQSQETEVY